MSEVKSGSFLMPLVKKGMGSSYKKSCTHALFITRAMTRSEPESDWKLPKEDEDPFHCFFSSSNLTVVG